MNQYRPGAYIIDLRDVVRERDDAADIGDDADYVAMVSDLADQFGDDLETVAEYEPTLILDSYFKDYAMNFADQIGAIENDMEWPACHIDWDEAAESLQMDFTSVEFGGYTYWTRGY